MKNYKNSINKKVVILFSLVIQAFLIANNFTLGQAIDPKNGVQISGDYYICGGAQAQYEYSVIGGCNSYIWSIEPLNFGTIVSGQNTNKIKVTWASNGIATLKVKTGTGCTDGGYSSKTLSFKVEVAPGKSPTSIKSSSGSFTFKCGSTITLSTEETKYLEYNWELPAGLTGVSKTNKIDVKVSDNFAGGYIYVTPVFPKSICGRGNDYAHPRLTAGAAACSSTSPPPPSENDISGNAICCNQEFYLTGGIPLPLRQSTSSVLKSASGSPLFIQWATSTDGNTFTDIPGATNQDLTFNTAINKTTFYRRRVGNGSQISYSNAVSVTISPVSYCSTPKPIEESLYFDGVDDRVYFETLPEDDENYSIDFWIKSEDYSKEQLILSLGNLRIGLKEKKIYIQDVYRRKPTIGSAKDFSQTNYSSILDVENGTWQYFRVNIRGRFPNRVKCELNNSVILDEMVGAGIGNDVSFKTRGNVGFIGKSFNGYIRNVRIWGEESSDYRPNSDCQALKLLSFFPLDDVCNGQSLFDLSGNNCKAYLGSSTSVFPIESTDPKFNEDVPISTQIFSYSTSVKAHQTLTIKGDISTVNSSVTFKAKKEIKVLAPSSIKPEIELKIYEQDVNCPPAPMPVPFSVVISSQQSADQYNFISLSGIVRGGDGNYTYQWYSKVPSESGYHLWEGANESDLSFSFFKGLDFKLIVTSGSETAEAYATVLCNNCDGSSNRRVVISPEPNSAQMSQKEATKINVFPNPSSGLFTIDFSNIDIIGSLIICDVFGKAIPYFTFNEKSKGILEIDLRGQADGMYFIHAQTLSGSIKKKIILNNKSDSK